MIIGITGSTSGIGKSFKEHFDCVTYDRNDGELYQHHKVYEKLKHCDVFVNNAFDNLEQSSLLLFFYNEWKNHEKKIVNIGSWISSYRPMGDPEPQYIDHKKRLAETHRNIVSDNNKCKSYLMNPGLVDTRMTQSVQGKKLSTDNVIEIFKYLMHSKVYIPEIYFNAE